MKDFDISKEERAQRAESHAVKAANSNKLTQGSSWKDTKTSQDAQSYLSAQEQQKSWQKADSFQGSLGMKTEANLAYIGNEFTKNPEGRAAYAQMQKEYQALTANGQNTALKQNYQGALNNLKGKMGGEVTDQVKAAAMFKALRSQSSYQEADGDPGKNTENDNMDHFSGVMSAHDALASARGMAPSSNIDNPYRNETDLTAPPAMTDADKKKHETDSTLGQNEVAGEPANIDPNKTPVLPQTGVKAVEATNKENQGNITQTATEKSSAQRAETRQEKIETYNNEAARGHGDNPPTAAKMFAAKDAFNNQVETGLKDGAEKMSAAGAAAWKANSDAFQKLEKSTPEEREQFTKDTDEYLASRGMDANGSLWEGMKANAANAGLSAAGFLGSLVGAVPGSVEKPEDMSNRDYAAYSLMAHSMGADAGTEAWQEKHQELENKFYAAAHQEGTDNGLSDGMAEFYAQSHAYGTNNLAASLLPDAMGTVTGALASEDKKDAFNAMKMEEVGYLANEHGQYTNEKGDLLADGQKPIHDPAQFHKNEDTGLIELTNKTLDTFIDNAALTIDDAADTGRMAGSNLTQLGEINALRGNIVDNNKVL